MSLSREYSRANELNLLLQSKYNMLPKINPKAFAVDRKYISTRSCKKESDYKSLQYRPEIANILKYTQSKSRSSSMISSPIRTQSPMKSKILDPDNGRYITAQLSKLDHNNFEIESPLRLENIEYNRSLTNKFFSASQIELDNITKYLEEFLHPYTKNFIELIDCIKNEKEKNFASIKNIDFTNNSWKQNIENIKSNQYSRLSFIENIVKECLINKILIKHQLHEFGEILLNIFRSICYNYEILIEKYELEYRKLQKKKTEKTYGNFSCCEVFNMINFIYNPLLNTSQAIKEEYSQNVANVKYYLIKNNGLFNSQNDYEIIMNFEEDFKKLSTQFLNYQQHSKLLEIENQRIREDFNKLNQRYIDDQKYVLFSATPSISAKNQEANDNYILEKSFMSTDKQNNSPAKNQNFQTANSKGNSTMSSTKRMSRHTVTNDLTINPKETNDLVNNYLTNELKASEEHRMRIQAEYDKLVERTIEMQNKISILESKKPKMPTIHQEIQVQFPIINEKAKEKNCLTMDFFTDPSIESEVLHQEEWVSSVINMIYCEKIIADVYDDLERRPRSDLITFTRQWFFCKIGIQNMGSLFLRDFFHSVKNYAQLHPRYKNFLILCGQVKDLKLINDFEACIPGLAREKNDSKEAFSRLYLKKAFLSSRYGSSIMLKIIQVSADIIKRNHGNKEGCTLLPTINIDNDSSINHELYSISDLLEIMKEIFSSENIPSEISKLILEEFNSLTDSDLYFQLLERSKRNDGMITLADNINAISKVRFDFFCQFLLNKLSDYYLRDAELIHNAIKMSSGDLNESDLKYDSFKSTIEYLKLYKSSRWIDLIYNLALMQDVRKNPPLYKALANIIPVYKECILWSTQKQVAQTNSKIHHHDFKYTIISSNNDSNHSISDILNQEKKIFDVFGSHKILKMTFNYVIQALSKESMVSDNEKIIKISESGIREIIKQLEKELNLVGSMLSKLNGNQKDYMSEKEKIIKILDTAWKNFRLILKYGFSN